MNILDMGRDKPNAEMRFYENNWAKFQMERINRRWRRLGDQVFGSGDRRRAARRAYYWGIKWQTEVVYGK